ncbi:MAG: hypothetical protein HQM03_20865 [Magnetococcales bacterium]|nr:hypothetical protein [Magnetococcales bacterium]
MNPWDRVTAWWNKALERREIMKLLQLAPGISLQVIHWCVGDHPDWGRVRDNLRILERRRILTRDGDGRYWPTPPR